MTMRRIHEGKMAFGCFYVVAALLLLSCWSPPSAPLVVQAWVVMPPPSPPSTTTTTTLPSSYQQQPLSLISNSQQSSFLNDAAMTWLLSSSSSRDVVSHYFPTTTTTTMLVADAAAPTEQQQPPSEDDVALLRQAFAELYGDTRDVSEAIKLFTQTIDRWTTTQQPPDEVAALYRVRGDAYVMDGQAVPASADYQRAVSLLEQKDAAAAAGPAELPAALLGRARSTKSLLSSDPKGISQQQIQQTCTDYRRALVELGRNANQDYADDMTETELIEEGAQRNPFVPWEYGDMLRLSSSSNNYQAAATAHELARDAFTEIGDKARAVISQIDLAIDLVGSGTKSSSSQQQAYTLLQDAIDKLSTKNYLSSVRNDDLRLLFHVAVKQGEAEIALASLTYNSGTEEVKASAEKLLEQACTRFNEAEELQTRLVLQQQKQKQVDTTADRQPASLLRYSIDDDKIAWSDPSCVKFADNNAKYVTDQLHWPEPLIQQLKQLPNSLFL